MAIWVMHGVVAEHQTSRFTHRLLLDYDRTQRFLAMRGPIFVDIDEALRGDGDALTIDDSTVAAADAATLCRALGHEVTVFINARNIALNQTYWFALLNSVIDCHDSDAVALNGTRWPTSTYRGRQSFRKAAKHAALALDDDASREEFILNLAHDLGVDEPEVPAHLATMSLGRLRELQELGVRIENHGWTHGNVTAMTTEEILDDIDRGSRWLESNLNVRTKHYAVPFGEATPPTGMPLSESGIWFLADENRPAAMIAPSIINRAPLVV